MAEFIGVTLTQDSVQVVPGESATIGITVRNDSNVVDVLYIAVEGLDPSWYQLSVVQSSLFPGDQASGTLTITPPKTSDSVARNYPFSIKSTSQKDSTQSTSLPVQLEVGPFYSFEMNLHPQKATGARGSYKLGIKNTGNADLNIALEGQDPEDLCRFTFDHQRPRVSPGQEFEVAVEVEPGKRPFKGRAKSDRLTLTGTPDAGTAEPASVLAELDATARLPGIVGRVFKPFRRPRAPTTAGAVRPPSRFPRWAMIAAGAVVAVVILAVVLVFAFGGDGLPTYEDSFTLKTDLNNAVVFQFDIPDTDVTLIHAEVKWSESNDAVQVEVLPPNGDPSSVESKLIYDSGGTVSFRVDGTQAMTGWTMTIRNTSTETEAEVDLKVSFSK